MGRLDPDNHLPRKRVGLLIGYRNPNDVSSSSDETDSNEDVEALINMDLVPDNAKVPLDPDDDLVFDDDIVPDENVVPDEDVEALIAMDSPTKTATAFAAASSSDSFSAPSGSGRSPLFFARVVFRKVIALMTDDHTSGTVTFLREVITGIILGVVCISVLLFLDHRDVIHIQSAHNFRDAATQLLSDPETLASIEESTGLVFMPMDKYESQLKEIESAASKKAEKEKELHKKTNEIEKMKKEVEAIKTQHMDLKNNPLLGLDTFCESCIWAMKVTCAARVQYMQDKYNMQPNAAKMDVMETPSCKKQP